MQQEFKKIEETVSHFKQYVDTKITKTKLDAAAKTSDVITYVVVGMLVTVIFFLFVIFVSDAAAYAIGNYFGKSWLGFLLVGGFYFLAGLLIWFSRERLLRIPIMNAIIERFFTQETEQDEEI